ncbi:MAG: hypothetical protein ACLRQF_18865 [Thomasclavelia ramosa]
MRDFYENKLGLKAKIIMRYGAYLGQKSRGAWAKKQLLIRWDCLYFY